MLEIEKLINWIKDNQYNYEIKNRDYNNIIDNKIYKGKQVKIKDLDFSAIWIHGSYGYEEGLIEVMCKVNYADNSVIGNLTCEECINLLKNYEVLSKLTEERKTEIDKQVNQIENYFDKQIREIIEGEK